MISEREQLMTTLLALDPGFGSTIGRGIGAIALYAVVGLVLMVFGFGATVTSLIRAAKQSKRKKRLAAGLCPRCGYDLRACGERCSECGASRIDDDLPLQL